MATKKLNPKFCDKAPQGNHFDGDGMYLMVTPDGKKYWRIAFSALGSFIVALNGYGGHSLTKAAIWMMLYTGMRQASIRRAVWQDFDLEKAVWNRRPEKADKEVHVLSLPKQAIALLEEIKPLTGQGADDLVFPSVRSAYHPMSEAAIG